MGCPGAPRTERPLAGGRLAVWDGGGIRAGQLPWLQGEVKSKFSCPALSTQKTVELGGWVPVQGSVY